MSAALLREVTASVHGAVDPSALRAEGVDPAAIVDFSSNQSPLGAAGFFLIHAGEAPAARRALPAQGCLVRDCTSFGLPRHIRVSPRHPEQNDVLLAAFAALTPPEAAS